MIKNLNFIIGGAQGAGLETTAQILTKAFATSGFGVIMDREYYSNIKGRHSYVHARVSSTRESRSLSSKVELLGCMDTETFFTHFQDVKEDGFIIYDRSNKEKKLTKIKSMEDPLKERLAKKFNRLGIEGDLKSLVKYLEETRDLKIIDLDFPSILESLQKEYEMSSSQASRYISSILIGSIAGITDLDKKAVKKGIKNKFEEKTKIAEQNIFLSNYVSDMVEDDYSYSLSLSSPEIEQDKLMIVNGNEITAMGKMAGGLSFQSYYPITPAADESFFIDKNSSDKKDGVLVLQTEDEIAAITSCIGAALTGARSATSTSGPGFALMVEGLGWAGINEVPIVITYYQRGGPSTGMPTRGSQEDLMNALYSSHGCFPRIILTSGDHEEAFEDAIKVFNLAEKYQTPVIHLLDKYLANMVKTIPLPDLEKLQIERGNLFDGNGEEYNRFSEGAISERAFLGEEVMWYTGSEHSKKGHVTEDPEIRVNMQRKRMEKLEIADDKIKNEDKAIYFGSENADNIIVGWGSVKNVILDIMEELDNTAYLHLKMFSPFPKELVERTLKGSQKVIAVEHSYSVRISDLIKLNTGIKIENEVVKFTGRPMFQDEVKDSINRILSGESQREVLKHGS